MRGIDTFLAIKEQADLFTPKALSDLVAGDFLSFDSESLSGNQQIVNSKAIRPQPMRTRANSSMGTVEAGGSLSFTASNFVLDKLLPLIFHSKTGNVEDPAGATYTLVEKGKLTPFTVFVGFDEGTKEFTRRFTGCKVDRATISARVNEMLNISLEVVGINKEIQDQTTTAVYPGGDVEYAYDFDQASVQLKAGDMTNLAELPVENFNLTINHNLAKDKYRLNSLYRRSLEEGMTEIDGDFTIDMAVDSVAGSALNLAGGVTTDPAYFERLSREAKFAALTFTCHDKSVEVSPGVYAKFEITLPFIRLQEPDFQVRDAGTISGSAKFQAYDSVTATHITKLTLQ